MNSQPSPRRRPWHACIALLGALALSACSGGAPPIDHTTMVQEWAAFMQRDYVLRPGDRLTVTVYQNDDLTQEITISPTGTVNLRRLPDGIRGAGLSVAAFRQQVQTSYADILNDAEVSVTLNEPTATTIFVTGEVKSGGPIAYVPGMTTAQAIAAAGGLEITAKCTDVRVLRAGGTAGARTQRVNVHEVLYESAADFMLLPGDVVFCQTSGIADAGNWVTLWIRRLLPFNLSGIAIGR